MTMHPQQELAWIFTVLWNDMTMCSKHLGKKTGRTGNPWRRHYLRAFFALVEAATHHMRKLLVARSKEGKFEPSEAEVLGLSLGQYEKNKDKTKRRYFFRTLELIKFSLQCFAKHVQLENQLKMAFSKSAWRDFTQIQENRDNITHPKCIDDLILGDDFMLTLKNAGVWFFETVNLLIGVDYKNSSAAQKPGEIVPE